VGGGGGEDEFNQRSYEARPTPCRVGPARVSSPQVDLMHSCGLLVEAREARRGGGALTRYAPPFYPFYPYNNEYPRLVQSEGRAQARWHLPFREP